MSDRLPEFITSAIDANGDTLSGAQVFFYQVGTTTKKDTYSDSAKTSANTNPMVLDTIGRLATDVFMDTDVAYKVVLAPSTDTDPPTSAIRTWDDVSPVLQPGTFPVLAIVSKSANHTVLTTERGAIILVDASSGAVTITLLAVATAASGFSVTVMKIDSSSNAVTVDGNLSETINGATTQTLGAQYDVAEQFTDGTAWYLRVSPVDVTQDSYFTYRIWS